MSATKVRTSNTRLIAVTKVSVPAMSTIGYGSGVDEDGRRVRFVGDHRPLRDLGEALTVARDPILVRVEPWQDVGVDGARE